MCNDYGLDAIEMGDVLAMYFEAKQRGYTNGGWHLRWGDYMYMVEIVDKIGKREGIGDILAEGTERAAKHFGHPEIAMTVKGMAYPPMTHAVIRVWAWATPPAIAAPATCAVILPPASLA